MPYLTNSSMLKLEVLPRHLLIVGGSYIGLEFAQMYRRFGSEVTVVEKSARLLGHEDEDIAAEIRRILEAEGIGFRTEAECIRLASRQSDVVVQVDCSSGDREISGSHVLLAVGDVRTPMISDWKRPESQSTAAAISWSTRSCARTTRCLGAGGLQWQGGVHPHGLQ